MNRHSFAASVITLLILIAISSLSDSLAVIVDHYEGGYRELYDTNDPKAAGCESPDLICTLPPPPFTTNNATGNTTAIVADSLVVI